MWTCILTLVSSLKKDKLAASEEIEDQFVFRSWPPPRTGSAYFHEQNISDFKKYWEEIPCGNTTACFHTCASSDRCYGVIEDRNVLMSGEIVHSLFSESWVRSLGFPPNSKDGKMLFKIQQQFPANSATFELLEKNGQIFTQHPIPPSAGYKQSAKFIIPNNSTTCDSICIFYDCLEGFLIFIIIILVFPKFKLKWQIYWNFQVSSSIEPKKCGEKKSPITLPHALSKVL